VSYDSPPLSWYEPPDEPEDDEPELPDAAEALVIAHGIVLWTAAA